MHIEITQRKDREAALAIARGLPEYFTAQALKSMEKSLEQDTMYGAYAEGNIAGFVALKELNSDVIEVSWLAVRKEHQGQGIGTRLVREILEVIGNYKVCQVKTLADTVEDAGYEKTRAFYRKLGFVPLEVIDPYPGWDDPGQIWVKCLCSKYD